MDNISMRDPTLNLENDHICYLKRKRHLSLRDQGPLAMATMSYCTRERVGDERSLAERPPIASSS